MQTMTFPAGGSYGNAGVGSDKLTKIAVVVVLHAALGYAVVNGTMHRLVDRIPEVVNVTFVAPPPAPPPAAQPKTVEVAPKAPAITPPPLPMLPIVIENTITPPPSPARVTEAAPSTPVAAPASAAPPAPPAPSGPRVISAVEYIRAPQPVYPSLSRRMGEQGVVTLRVLVNEKGHAEQASIQKSSGSSNLDEAGRAAVMRALFKPYVEDGKAQPVYVVVPINFQIS